MTNVTFDAETNDVESRLEGGLEMIDQDVSEKLVEVVEKWKECVSIDRYRFRGGEVHKMYASRSSRYDARYSTNY